jgi:maltose O-acetyltransferase
VRSLLFKLLGVKLGKNSKISHGCFIGSPQLDLHNDCFINVFAFLDGSAKITFKDGVRLGPHVRILTGTHAYRNSVFRRLVDGSTLASPVVIERGCWIGMGATILPGVTIAEGCIVAAGAVISKSTEPNGLYAGVPARRIKDLSIEEDLAKEYS